MQPHAIRINDRTNRKLKPAAAKVIALDSDEKIVDLGGFDKYIEGYPNTLWNPQGNLDYKREVIGNKTLARNTIRILLRGRNRMTSDLPVENKPVIDTDRLTKEFNELLEQHGFDSEQSADVALMVASGLKLGKEKVL